MDYGPLSANSGRSSRDVFLGQTISHIDGSAATENVNRARKNRCLYNPADKKLQLFVPFCFFFATSLNNTIHDFGYLAQCAFDRILPATVKFQPLLDSRD
jgi:hypothetical protein